MIYLVNDDVLGLYVPVNNTVGVQLLNGCAYLLHQTGSFNLGHRLAPL
jgi:formate hydrogenlyase subunit 3/multisubunit Na+/H+ antiporter MnhD subunit